MGTSTRLVKVEGKLGETVAAGASKGMSPYVRYILSADTNEKGIGFAVQRAAKAFLDSHGFQSTFKVLERSSDRFEAVLSLYDNGNYDFNMKAFVEHIHSSGRMPSNVNVKPRVEIKPMACDEAISISQMPPSDMQWMKTVEGLNERLKRKDEQIRGLETTVNQLSNAISERRNELTTLGSDVERYKKMLSEMAPTRFNDALSAAVFGFAVNYGDDLICIADDIETLRKTGDEELFAKSGTNLKTRVAYVNHKLRQSFASEEDLVNWMKAVTGVGGWENSAVGVALSAALRQYKTDEGVFDGAQKAGASSEILSLLKSAVEKRKENLDEIVRRAEMDKADFEKKRDLVPKIEEESARYSEFEGVLKSVAARKQILLPVVVAVKLREPSLEIYVPSFDAGNAVESRVIHSAGHSVLDRGLSFEAPVFEKGISTYRVSSADRAAYEGVFDELVSDDSSISRDPLLSSLGVKTEVIGIRA